jgi:hypothetical protein
MRTAPPELPLKSLLNLMRGGRTVVIPIEVTKTLGGVVVRSIKRTKTVLFVNDVPTSYAPVPLDVSVMSGANSELPVKVVTGV